MHEELEHSPNTLFFHVFSEFCGSSGAKSRLAKEAGAEPSGEMRHEQLHAVVVPSTFGSRDVKNTSTSEHFGS